MTDLSVEAVRNPSRCCGRDHIRCMRFRGGIAAPRFAGTTMTLRRGQGVGCVGRSFVGARKNVTQEAKVKRLSLGLAIMVARIRHSVVRMVKGERTVREGRSLL